MERASERKVVRRKWVGNNGFDGYESMHGMSDMERASERKGDGKENGYETMGS